MNRRLRFLEWMDGVVETDRDLAVRYRLESLRQNVVNMPDLPDPEAGEAVSALMVRLWVVLSTDWMQQNALLNLQTLRGAVDETEAALNSRLSLHICRLSPLIPDDLFGAFIQELPTYMQRCRF